MSSRDQPKRPLIDETPEERRERLNKRNAANRARLAAETEEQAKARRAKQAQQKKAKRAAETEEEKIARRLNAQAQRARIRLARIAEQKSPRETTENENPENDCFSLPMATKRNATRYCAVTDCTNSQWRLREWNKIICEIHKELLHEDCPCPEPFSLHQFPENEEEKSIWLKNLNRSNYTPGKGAMVCSVHFVDGEPTETNPHPILQLTDKSEGMESSGRQLRKSTLEKPEKFLENWNPESSNRETRKLTRKIYSEGGKKKILYDENGILITAKRDLCDCVVEDCPGCHLPCPKCSSRKCGHECRNNRRWIYDLVEIEGSDKQFKNRYKK